MKKLQTHGLLRLTAFVLAVSFVCMGDGEACGDTSGKKKYVIEKDSLGRLIVAWAEDSMKELQISIDGGLRKAHLSSNAGILFTPNACHRSWRYHRSLVGY